MVGAAASKAKWEEPKPRYTTIDASSANTRAVPVPQRAVLSTTAGCVLQMPKEPVPDNGTEADDGQQFNT